MRRLLAPIRRCRPREPANALTHLAGAVLATIALVLLVRTALAHGTARHLAGLGVFGVSLVLMYVASTLYHALPVSPRTLERLRRFDHIAIYCLIAGTYTPVGLLVLRGGLGTAVVVAVWAMALLGVAQKVVWLEAPEWFSTGCYLAMGWVAVFLLAPLARTASPWFLTFLALGGAWYTVGTIFFCTERPRLRPWFGGHELWHLCVLAGSASHFWAIWRYAEHPS